MNSTEDIADLGRQLWGEPNMSLSTRDELRYGSNGSKSVCRSKSCWYDHEAMEGGNYFTLYIKVHGKPPERGSSIVAAYDYEDETGSMLFQVVRMVPKTFRQRRPDGTGGWIWKTKGMRLVPYRLPQLLKAIGQGRTIFIAEGEKGVQHIESIGLTGTCSPGGAGKWRAQYNAIFADTSVVVLADNDPQAEKPDGTPLWHPDGRPVLPGQDHAADVARNLSGVARTVRVVMLPDLPLKGDVADWVAAGGTTEALERIAAETPEFDVAANPKPGPAKPETPSSSSLDGFDLTEDGIGLAFAKAHQDLLRYDHSIGKWFQWTGKAWRWDETRQAFSWSRRVCRTLAKEADAEGKLLAILGKASTAAAVERFAQSDPVLAVTSAIWDRDPYLLGTPGGTLDLRAGQLRDPVREDHITKLTAVTPSDGADCPLWMDFLNQVTASDEKLIRFLQQWCGYCLTGDVTEHALLFAHGPGGNGKGVFLNTVSKIMGDYAVTAAMDTFTASQSDRHPTDLAMLRGARLVTASETEEGRAWAESRIKTMTGGDRIRARFMRQDFFEYDPQFKLTIIGNHKPVLRNVDDAAKRRLNMAPFVFKPPVKDLKLEEKLQAEWPEILRWMIDGCLDWQQNGLIRPEVVTRATAEYFDEQDIVQQWIEDDCERGKTQFDTTAVLFKRWTDYAISNGEKAGTSKWFTQTLARLGYEPVKNTPGQHGKRGFKGISVRLVKTKDRTEPGQSDDGPAATDDSAGTSYGPTASSSPEWSARM
jgi:putative DNA primase/helicase